MNIDKIYLLLKDITEEIKKQQKEELTANATPIKIASNIGILEDMHRSIRELDDMWNERGIKHNLSNFTLH